MKNIAILVSGKGDSALRIVKLFNEGNRLKTVLVVADDTDHEFDSTMGKYDLTFLKTNGETWGSQCPQIAVMLKEKEVDLLVLDDFRLVIPDEIMESVNGEILRVSSPEQAPREVVAALEADLRKPVEETPVEELPKNENPTPESEWADALKINFIPPKIPSTPPEIPKEDVQGPEQPDRRNDYNPRQEFDHRSYNHPYHHRRDERKPEEMEPMPSTWLIWSVLSTIFCCFIPGIIAIIFSSQVSSRYYAGDIQGARRASRAAEIWIIVSVVLGVLSATLYLPFLFITS